MTLSHAMGTPARCCGKESSERFATSHGAYSNSSTGGGFSIRCFARYVGQAKMTCSARIQPTVFQEAAHRHQIEAQQIVVSRAELHRDREFFTAFVCVDDVSKSFEIVMVLL